MQVWQMAENIYNDEDVDSGTPGAGTSADILEN